MAGTKKIPAAIPLRERVTCPHCWEMFAPAEVMWVAEHPKLQGDPFLRKEDMRRFLPDRFTVEGRAIDSEGDVCHTLACPKCHLTIPRILLEVEPLFVSIVGAPMSGKSYFLASMTRRTRVTLPDKFGISFLDSDPEVNMVLNGFEDTLFSNDDQLTRLEKTQQGGLTYDSVRKNERTMSYPHPFIFTVARRSKSAPDRNQTRVLCLYDNAGEHFLPQGLSGAGANSVTDHLSRSRVILFLFDPLQHSEFRRACTGLSKDPQLANKAVFRQDQILLEAAKRVRNQSHLGTQDKIPARLLIVVTKYDAWCRLGEFAGRRLDDHWAYEDTPDGYALNTAAMKSMSNKVRALLMQLAPEIVTTAEGISDKVAYLPVSALGRSPERVGADDLRIRPCDVAPQATEVPLVYAIAASAKGLIAGVKTARAHFFQRGEPESTETEQTFAAAEEPPPKPAPPPPEPGEPPQPFRVVSEESEPAEPQPRHLRETGS